MIRFPLMHRACGGIAAFFTGDGAQFSPRLEAATFQRVDGTNPQKFAEFTEVCGACGEQVRGPGDLRLIHHKVIEIAQEKMVKDAYDPHGHWIVTR